MSETMVRKQLYLPRSLNQVVKRLAKQRGVTESEIMRQALMREEQMAAPMVRDSKKALEEIFTFVETLRNRPEFMEGKPYKFNRAEIYEEREKRWFKPLSGKE